MAMLCVGEVEEEVGEEEEEERDKEEEEEGKEEEEEDEEGVEPAVSWRRSLLPGVPWASRPSFSLPLAAEVGGSSPSSPLSAHRMRSRVF